MRTYSARNAFTTKIHPLDEDGEPLGFGSYTAGSDVDGSLGNLKAFFHILEQNSRAILTSVSGLFTTSIAHGLIVGDNIVIREFSDSINETKYVVATVPTAKTFTLTGYSGNGSGGKFHKIMKSDNATPIVLWQVLYRVMTDTDYANYTVAKGAKNVTEQTKYVIESWMETDGDSGVQLVQEEEIAITPTKGASPY